MSGIGLSPTDIVSGARVVGRGAAALRENGGSKDKYQQTAAGLDARIAAFSRLKEFAASAGPSASSSAVSVHASNLRRNDLALQNSQKKYDRRLGTNALGKRWRSIRWALGWEFRGHEEAKEYNHRSEAAKDALLLDTLLLGATTIEKRVAEVRSNTQTHTVDLSNSISQTGDSIIACINTRTDELTHEVNAGGDRIITNVKTRADEVLSGLQASNDAVIEAIAHSRDELTTQLRNGFAGVSQLITGLRADQASRVHSHRGNSPLLTPPQMDLPEATGPPLKRAQSHRPSGEYFKTWIAGFVPRSISAVQNSDKAHNAYQHCGPIVASRDKDQVRYDLDDDKNQVSKSFMQASLAMALCAVYGHPNTHSVIRRTLTQCREDPVFAMMLFFTGLCIARLLSCVPRSFLLSGDKLLFEDALGEQMRLAASLFRHQETFDSFLLQHFKHKPESWMVSAKKYRIIIGGSQGKPIPNQAWNTVVKPGCKITMAMLLKKGPFCPKCTSLLASTLDSIVKCPKCDQWYGTSIYDISENTGNPEKRENESNEDDVIWRSKQSSATNVFGNAPFKHMRLLIQPTSTYVCCKCHDGPKVWENQKRCVICNHSACKCCMWAKKESY